jgi:hypothetical protein
MTKISAVLFTVPVEGNDDDLQLEKGRSWLEGDATQSVGSALFGAFAALIVIAVVMLLACGGSRP